MLKRLLLLLTLLLFSSAALAAYSQIQTFSTPTGATTFAVLKEGGGGFVRGIAIESDGTYVTQIARTDSYNAYFWNATAASPGNAGGVGVWQPIVTTATLPANDPTNAPVAPCLGPEGCGVYEARVAPSNGNIAYVMINGYLYKTTNLQSMPNISLTATALPQCTTCVSNDGNAQAGPKIAIDPVNPSTVIVTENGGNVYYTTNGGTSFTQIIGPPFATPTSAAEWLVQFDPSTSSGGNTSGVYLADPGTGVYHSTTGPGGTYTLTSGGPTTNSSMKCGPDGELYFISGANNTLYLYNGSSWSTQSPGAYGVPAVAVALDPVHPTFASNAHIAVLYASGVISFTVNSGSSWTGPSSATTRTATDIPWLAVTNEAYMTAGQIAFDLSGVLHFSEGIGVWTTTPVTTANPTTAWVSQTAGIEQLVANAVVKPPGENPITMSWDRPVFTITNPAQFPTAHGLNYTNAIILGSPGDYSEVNPSFTALPADMFGAETSGYTSNNGGTDGGPSNWTSFPAFPGSFAITGISGTSSPYTVTATNVPAGIAAGTVLTVSGATPSSLDGEYVLTSSSLGSFAAATSFTITGISGTSSPYTVTATNMPVVPDGTVLIVSGVTPSSLDGSYTVTSSSAGSFVATTSATGTWSSGGSVATATGTWSSGGAVTGLYAGSVVNGGNGWGGAMAATTYGGNNVVAWMESDNGGLWIWNAGSPTTWALAPVPGLPAPSAAQGWINAYYENVSPICADRVNAGNFYAFNIGSSPVEIVKGTSGGTVWNQVMSGALTFMGGPSGPFLQMRCVPGVAGHMYGTAGNGSTTVNPYSPLFECTDSTPSSATGVVTCSGFGTTASVQAFGFGAPKPGGSGYPAIFLDGWVIQASTTATSSWTTSSTTIPVASCTGVVAGQGVYNLHSGLNVGTVSGCAGTTLTLTSAALSASLSSTDGLDFSLYGIWRSDDHAVTWNLLTPAPLNSLDVVRWIEGDPDVYGEVYGSFGGSGFFYGHM
jgi:hypothetical protein